MSRPLRIEFAGALYHITSRGNERNAIYRQDADRLLFFEVLEEVCRRYHLRITEKGSSISLPLSIGQKNPPGKI